MLSQYRPRYLYLPSVRISEENCEVRRIKSGCYMSALTLTAVQSTVR